MTLCPHRWDGEFASHPAAVAQGLLEPHPKGTFEAIPSFGKDRGSREPGLPNPSLELHHNPKIPQDLPSSPRRTPPP